MSCKKCITIEKGRRLNITAGTDVSLALRLHRDGAAFPVELSEGVGVFVVSSGGQRTGVAYEVGDGGIVLKSPNGTRFKITVADDGTLSVAAI